MAEGLRAAGGEAGRTYVDAPFGCAHLLIEVWQANDKSGYIGAAIVGSFIAVVLGWYSARFVYRKWQAHRRPAATKTEQ